MVDPTSSAPGSPAGPEHTSKRQLSVTYKGRQYSIVTERSEEDNVIKAIAFASIEEAVKNKVDFTSMTTTPILNENHEIVQLNVQIPNTNHQWKIARKADQAFVKTWLAHAKGLPPTPPPAAASTGADEVVAITASGAAEPEDQTTLLQKAAENLAKALERIRKAGGHDKKARANAKIQGL